MGNLYGKDAADPDWPSAGTSRPGKVEYSVANKQLTVKGSSCAGVFQLHQNVDTIIQIVEALNTLNTRRAREALTPYDDSLHRYLMAIMRRVADFYTRSKWPLVQKTLQDYESREQLGFKHDLEGRKAWNEHIRVEGTPNSEGTPSPSVGM